MEPHVWDRIQEIYHLAVALPPAERNDLVVRASESDPVLIQKVSSLLEAEASLSGFLEEPVCDLALRIMSQDTLTESIEPPNSSSMDSLINSTVGGRYLVESLLAEGGMARVYLSRDLTLDPKRVVLKVLLEKSLRNKEIVRKFRREKDALAQVAHPGVVTILDAGELPDNKPYLVMEYVDGVSLREVINAKPEGLPFERVAFIIRGIGSALNAVHRKEIYHRDLKPENIMLQNLGATEEQVKVVDFGIAKVRESLTGHTPIEDSGTMGTVAYMSPEQLRGDNVSAPSDVYSFAVVAFELLTGRRPFVFETPAHLWELQRQGIRAKPTALRPKLSEDAEAIILNGLSFEPKARLQADEFAARLSRALLEDVPRPPAVGRKPHRGRWLALAGAAVLVFAAMTGAYWLAGRPWVGTTTNTRSLPHRTLTYSFTVQRMRGGKPYLDPFESAEANVFESGDKFRLNVFKRQAGYLYIFSQGPPGQEVFNIIFPTPRANDGTARLEQNQDFQTNWNTFTGETGKERLWIVWSQNKVDPLDVATFDAFKNSEGAVSDPAIAKRLKDFLSENSKAEPETNKDAAKQRTSVRASGNLLVKLVELEHQ